MVSNPAEFELCTDSWREFILFVPAGGMRIWKLHYGKERCEDGQKSFLTKSSIPIVMFRNSNGFQKRADAKSHNEEEPAQLISHKHQQNKF